MESDSIGQVGRDTQVSNVNFRTILNSASGFVRDYDYTLNPYSGCYFGCTYCYAAFFTRNPKEQEDWGKWVKVKQNAADLLENHPEPLQGRMIYMSTVTDPYQPTEKKLGLVRNLLEILCKPGNAPKLLVQTRSPLVTRDRDLFQTIERNGGQVQVNMTVTTDDEDIRRAFEPSCPGNEARLRAIESIARSGIESCITLTPLLPVLDPNAFTDRLLQTGIRKFIVQPFRFNQGGFIANTREQAAAITAEKLGCEKHEYKTRYLENYDRIREILMERLPKLGEGQEGFKPPW